MYVLLQISYLCLRSFHQYLNTIDYFLQLICCNRQNTPIDSSQMWHFEGYQCPKQSSLLIWSSNAKAAYTFDNCDSVGISIIISTSQFLKLELNLKIGIIPIVKRNPVVYKKFMSILYLTLAVSCNLITSSDFLLVHFYAKIHLI